MHADTDQADLLELEALQSLIMEGREQDPLIGPKLGSKLGLDLLLSELGSERGVHAETLMAVAGCLIGISTQASLAMEASLEGRSRVPGLQVVRCQDQTTYLIGEPINQRLVSGYGSPWELLSEAAKQQGAEALPAKTQLLLQGIQRLGTPELGSPQVPATHAPMKIHENDLLRLWGRLRQICLSCCAAPSEWPLLCGLIGVRALRLVRPHLEPTLAFQIVMDLAIDTAKIPLKETEETN